MGCLRRTEGCGSAEITLTTAREPAKSEARADSDRRRRAPPRRRSRPRSATDHLSSGIPMARAGARRRAGPAIRCSMEFKARLPRLSLATSLCVDQEEQAHDRHRDDDGARVPAHAEHCSHEQQWRDRLREFRVIPRVANPVGDASAGGGNAGGRVRQSTEPIRVSRSSTRALRCLSHEQPADKGPRHANRAGPPRRWR
jgi:hypothetical protein